MFWLSRSTGANGPGLRCEPSVTRRSFALLGAATLGCRGANALQPRVSTAPAAAALRGDGDLVERAYEALHPGLYRYNTPAQMRDHFDVLRSELAEAAASSEWQSRAYLALTRMTARVRCGHTYANFFNQSDAVRRSLFERTNRTPCQFRRLDGRMVVTRESKPRIWRWRPFSDCSAEARVKRGDSANLSNAPAPAARTIMPNALTPAQFEIMRRIRDDGTLLDREPVANATRELRFLFALELLTYDASGVLILSELGAAYLTAADQEGVGTAAGPSSGDPQSDRKV